MWKPASTTAFWVPFLMFFIALAAARIEGGAASLMQFIVEQLGYGVLVGGGIGLVGGWLLGLARRIGWMEESFQQIGVVALPMLCLVVCEMIGASMFIAAFVAGWAVQIGFKEAGKHSVEFAEGWGTIAQLLRIFPFWLGRRASLAAVQPGIGAVCGSQPDGGADAAGGDRAHWHASEPGQCGVYGLVRPAWAGAHRSRAGLFGAGNAFARRGNDTACGNSDSAA
jgi:hypothetical protein